ncbi:MAG TPA: YbaK/EbsC family protein [Galbitalea sp.]|jgi:prolyl-tRNA editing enzyme YbaK/EbsC (Cys-tRNA(Pro) deacylase)
MYTLGSLTATPASEHPDLLAPTVRDALLALGLGDRVGVVEIDPDLSDTAATQGAYGLTADTLANCVIVTGKREGDVRTAACVVLATTRANINGLVQKKLDVRKASFMERSLAVDATGMEFGGITPFGLPSGWPIFVDERVAQSALVITGSGIRRSKLLVPGDLFASVPGVEIVPELGRLIEV